IQITLPQAYILIHNQVCQIDFRMGLPGCQSWGARNFLSCKSQPAGIQRMGSPHNDDSLMKILTAVTCKRCGNRIKLSPKSSYDPFHWMRHRKSCLRKAVGAARAVRQTPKDIYTSPAKKSPSDTDGDSVTTPPLTPDHDLSTVDTNDLQVDLPLPTASVAQNSEGPSSSPGRPIRRVPGLTIAQRRAYLRDDPLAGEVEPRRVFCRGCQKWIRLASKTQYALFNWHTHRLRCRLTPKTLRRTDFSPGRRIATAARKSVLLNDPQVKDFATGRVQCRTCKTVVDLEEDVDYELTKWTKHKETCIPMTLAPITPQGSQSLAFSPPSTSSSHATETTVTAESSPAAVKVGEKRGREEETEDEDEEAEDARPTNRPRTETYTPPVKDVLSVFGWLMQSLKEFTRGFRAGLGST
ncbi:hypothetical protein OG21DRAFT_1510052, partial [Imleria badia]